MSVSVAAEPCRKRPIGFTIDSIIGKESDKRKSDCPKSSSSSQKSFRLSEEKQQAGYSIKQDGLLDARYRLSEGVRSSGVSDFNTEMSGRPFHLSNSHKHLQNSNVDSLKHLHEVLAQTAGATGTYFHPRMCRHPLSALNLHTVYPSQTSPVHPVVMESSTRDVRSLHPWMSDRFSSYFYPRYPVTASPGFLFQPYRKPKRIRTAFSPAQLLQLEKAFEKSHYVVGQERKDLAGELQLTETQVKVWFQNRRTKHKRMKAEEGDGKDSDDMGGNGNRCSSPDMSSDISDEMDLDVSDDEIMNEHHTLTGYT